MYVYVFMYVYACCWLCLCAGEVIPYIKRVFGNLYAYRCCVLAKIKWLACTIHIDLELFESKTRTSHRTFRFIQRQANKHIAPANHGEEEGEEEQPTKAPGVNSWRTIQDIKEYIENETPGAVVMTPWNVCPFVAAAGRPRVQE